MRSRYLSDAHVTLFFFVSLQGNSYTMIIFHTFCFFGWGSFEVNLYFGTQESMHSCIRRFLGNYMFQRVQKLIVHLKAASYSVQPGFLLMFSIQ